jgi:hypothetical protein
MATEKVSTDGIGIRYGVFASIAMIIYFIVMNLAGLAHLEAVRFMSHAFILIAVVLAIGTYKRINGGNIPYLPGLGVGFVVGLTAAVIYAIFIFAYANFINTDFLAALEEQDYYGTRLSPFMLFASIVILGIAVGSMTGYTLMMLYDKSGGEFEER